VLELNPPIGYPLAPKDLAPSEIEGALACRKCIRMQEILLLYCKLKTTIPPTNMHWVIHVDLTISDVSSMFKTY
jgi:hypothetical protein